MVVELFSFSNPFLFRITPCSKKMPITSFVTNLLPSFLYKHYFPTKKIAAIGAPKLITASAQSIVCVAVERAGIFGDDMHLFTTKTIQNL